MREESPKPEIQQLFASRHHDLHDEVLFQFQGKLNHKQSLQLLKRVESELVESEPILSTRKKVFEVAMEMLRNIIAHGAYSEDYPPIFLIGEQEGCYLLMTINLVASSKQSELLGRLEQLNSLDKEGLNARYKEVMKTPVWMAEDSDSGLGLIKMARKGVMPFAYNFRMASADHAYFALIAEVKKKRVVAEE